MQLPHFLFEKPLINEAPVGNDPGPITKIKWLNAAITRAVAAAKVESADEVPEKLILWRNVLNSCFNYSPLVSELRIAISYFYNKAVIAIAFSSPKSA